MTRRDGRRAAGQFLAEGPQATGEAVKANLVVELFVTAAAARRHPATVSEAQRRGARVSLVTDRAAESLSETTTPQGIVAVCPLLSVPLSDALRDTRLVAVLGGVSDPGNAGTVIRVADAAGADAVVLAGDAVDPHNGKCVRASTGSLFHVALAVERDSSAVLRACRQAGLTVIGADAAAVRDMDDAIAAGTLARPLAWWFGSEAHGLTAEVRDAVSETIAVPIYGRAESLNLATAAAVCLYASARSQRDIGGR